MQEEPPAGRPANRQPNQNENQDLQSPPTAARYIVLAQALLAIATFAGAITFSALLANPAPSWYVRKLLGFAIALFFGSVIGSFPILVRMQIVKDTDSPKGWTRYLVIAGLTTVAVLIITAFGVLLAVVKVYTCLAAFVVGVVLVSLSAFSTLWAAGYNIWTLFP